MDLSAFTAQEIVMLCHRNSAEHLMAEAHVLSPQQISMCVSVLTNAHDPGWKEKLVGLFKGMKGYPQLEAAGKTLTLQQALEVFDHSAQSFPKDHWKLSPLLVGMQHHIFTQLLIAASPQHMEILRHEVITEPVQHHLSLITHEIVRQLPSHIDKIPILEEMITNLNIKEIGHAELGFLMGTINQEVEYYQDTLNKITKTLALAWNSNRTDLIEGLSSAKETCQKTLALVLGYPRTSTRPPSGFYSKIEKRLGSVYGDPNDPNDIEASSNDEPALEALAKFSIWYIKDYWELGLLPGVNNAIEIDQIENKDAMIDQARENLGRLGLNTVGDLKQAGIFSRKSLQEYITYNRYLFNA